MDKINKFDNQLQSCIRRVAEKNNVSTEIVSECFHSLFFCIKKEMISGNKEQIKIPYFGRFNYSYAKEFFYLKRKSIKEKRLKDEKCNNAI